MAPALNDPLATLKALVEEWHAASSHPSNKVGFAHTITARLNHVEASVTAPGEAPTKLEARVVTEVTVTPDMCQGWGTMHGGCSAYLIDNCSTMPIMLLDKALGNTGRPGVSLSLNVVFHSPAQPGALLRIVCTTLAGGERTMTARAEIWDATNKRLVASGTHIKMQPSPKQAARL